MQTIFKTTSKLIYKTSIASLLVATLVASGGTGDTGGGDIGTLFVGVKKDATNHTAKLRTNTILASKTGNEKFSVSYKGKDYELTEANRYKGNQYLHNKVDGDVEVTLQNLSKDLHIDKYGLTNDKVELWQIAFEDAGSNSVDIGYQIYGSNSADLPNASVALYKGRMGGYSVGKTDPNDQFWLNGEVNLNADFNIGKQSISGKIDKITTQKFGSSDVVNSTTVMSIADGQITDGKFAGSLSITKNGEPSTVIKSAISGAFYGDNAAEIGGLGSLETDGFITSFGFVGKKE